jgi:hypothetical protein
MPPRQDCLPAETPWRWGIADRFRRDEHNRRANLHGREKALDGPVMDTRKDPQLQGTAFTNQMAIVGLAEVQLGEMGAD